MQIGCELNRQPHRSALLHASWGELDRQQHAVARLPLVMAQPPRNHLLLPWLQVISAELDYKLACTGYNVRLFVVDVLATMVDGGR